MSFFVCGMGDGGDMRSAKICDFFMSCELNVAFCRLKSQISYIGYQPFCGIFFCLSFSVFKRLFARTFSILSIESQGTRQKAP